jgi:hypothetical protein
MVYRVYAKNRKQKKWYQEENWYGAGMVAFLDWLERVLKRF